MRIGAGFIAVLAAIGDSFILTHEEQSFLWEI